MAKGRIIKIGKVTPKTWEEALQEFLFLKKGARQKFNHHK
jgi:hypothetical protein